MQYIKPLFFKLNQLKINIKVKWSRYRPGVAQMVASGIALLFHDRGTRKGWVVSRTPRPHFTSGKDPVPIVQEAGWAPGPVWTGGKSRPHRDSIPDHPAHSQSLYRLSYPAHKLNQSSTWNLDLVANPIVSRLFKTQPTKFTVVKWCRHWTLPLAR